MTTRWFSLRRQLLLLLLTGVTLAWLGAMTYAYIEARHAITHFLEEEQKQTDEHLRHELAEHFLEALLMPLLFGLPVLGGWLWFAAWRGLKPLDEMAREIAEREPQRLDPVTPETAPREIRPLIEALNSLFARVAAAMEKERRFTADAAHELRTPLAAIRAQAQVAARARDEAERQHALEQLAASAQRAAHLMEQLTTLARLDPAAPLPMAELRLDQLAAEVCAEQGAQALAKDITLALAATEAAPLMGNEAMLRVLLRNLIDNAIRYTPQGGRVVVTITHRAGRLTLAVCDDGPGISPELRALALERFHRLAGQDTEGSGLGLSIATRIAELHGAHLELDEGLDRRGLCVRVQFAGHR
jgi:two-component system sensor histidine kinase QseC